MLEDPGSTAIDGIQVDRRTWPRVTSICRDQKRASALSTLSEASFGFPACRKHAVEVDFSGGAVSSNGGCCCHGLPTADLGSSAAAARVLRDPRDPRCRHSALAQLRQRVSAPEKSVR